MSGPAPYSVKKQARYLFEVEGDSYAAIGRDLGYGNVTVAKWAKDEGWVKAGTKPEPEVETFPEPNPFEGQPMEPEFSTAATYHKAPDPPGSEQELRDRLAALEAENTALTEKVDELSPTKDIGGMFTDRVEWLEQYSPEGGQYWVNRAEAEYMKINKERALQGLPGYDIKNHPEILEQHINELKTKEAMGIDNSLVEPASRKVKLFIMRNGMPTIEQIPMENQINNMAGSLADGIIRYTRKGFKLTNPFLCPRAGCFHPAGVDEFQRWEHDGYCTERHRNEVEGPQESPTAGLMTRDVMTRV